MHLCVFVTWGKKAIDIMSFINVFIQHSTVCNWNKQGNTCYLTKVVFSHDLNHLTVTVFCLVVFCSGTIVSFPVGKGGWVKVSDFFKIGKKGQGSQG